MPVPLKKSPIVQECVGCSNIEGEVCRIWATPAAKWRLGSARRRPMWRRKSRPRRPKSAWGSKSRRKS